MSTFEPNLYERLELTPGATQGEITAAYHRLALALHPDSATERADPHALQDVIVAHRVLSDPQQRRDYDRHLATPTVSKPARVRPRTCGVCHGTGIVTAPCQGCAGTGYRLTHAPWIQHLVLCPDCRGRKGRPIPCGACGTTGNQ